MRRPKPKTASGCGVVVALLSASANAIDLGPYEIAIQTDVRWVGVDSPYASFTEGGTGLSRFDEAHDGFRLGRFLVNFNGPLTETLRADVTLSGTGDSDVNAIDVTEAFIEWRPYPQSSVRWRTRVGAFYPPVSLENRGLGWQSLYSISPSAINTWFGEEIRAIGIEQSMTIGAADARSQFTLSGSLYQWNDPMGVLLFQRGWAIHDRQTALFDEVPRPFPRFANETTINFFREIDNRIGYYLSADYKLDRNFTLRALHYDNNGDPSIRGYKDSAWRSRFDALGTRYEFPTATTLIAQWLKGDTAVGPSPDNRGMFIIDYWSYFGLASQEIGAHRVTARYDRMTTEPIRGANIFNSRQNATAWTFAYLWNVSSAWQLAAEYIDLRGSLAQRARRGLPTFAHEKTWQLAVRFTL